MSACRQFGHLSVSLLGLALVAGCAAPLGTPGESDKANEYGEVLRSCEVVVRSTSGWPSGSCVEGCEFQMEVAVDRAHTLGGFPAGLISVYFFAGHYDDPDNITEVVANVEVLDEKVEPRGDFERVVVVLDVSVDSLPAPLLQYQVNVLAIGRGVAGTKDYPFEDVESCRTPESYLTSMIMGPGYLEGGTVVDGEPTLRYTQFERDQSAKLWLRVEEEPQELPPGATLHLRHLSPTELPSPPPHVPVAPGWEATDLGTHHYMFDLTELDPYAGRVCWDSELPPVTYGFYVSIEGSFSEELRSRNGDEHVITFHPPPPCGEEGAAEG